MAGSVSQAFRAPRNKLKRHGKSALLSFFGRITRRHVALLPSEARSELSILNLRTYYRVESSALSVDLHEPGPGSLTVSVFSYEGHFPTKNIWRGASCDYAGPSRLEIELPTGAVRLNGWEWGRVAVPLLGRRFCLKLALAGSDGHTRKRVTGHYVAAEQSAIDASYFRGNNYVDHEQQSAADHGDVVRLLQQHGQCGPVLEIGCATGGLMAAMDASGFDSVGLDVSEWAVAQARQRLGSRRAWVCNVEKDAFPTEVVSRGPFQVLILWAVLEHLREPFAVLAKLTPLVAPGGLLLLNTTNAGSLTHMLFARQWEGHFDGSHHSVDQLSVGSLATELPRLGWRIERIDTDRIWDGDADPTRATLRDWWVADARFRHLIRERNLGDFIRCIARRECESFRP